MQPKCRAQACPVKRVRNILYSSVHGERTFSEQSSHFWRLPTPAKLLQIKMVFWTSRCVSFMTNVFVSALWQSNKLRGWNCDTVFSQNKPSTCAGMAVMLEAVVLRTEIQLQIHSQPQHSVFLLKKSDTCLRIITMKWIHVQYTDNYYDKPRERAGLCCPESPPRTFIA